VTARFSRRLLVVAAAASCAAFALHGPRSTGEGRTRRPLFEGAEIDRPTLRLFERACQDCHSDRTGWPWYASVPVAGWLLDRGVRRGRESVDFSRWPEYNLETRSRLLSAIGAAARTGTMPPRLYLVAHPRVALSLAEKERIYEWTLRERKALAPPPEESPPAMRWLWERRY
jgi:hypothetical protein